MATAVDSSRAWFEAEGITKSFGGQAALRGVDIGLGRGEVLGLIGENGAGKSTFLNIACGVFPPDAGTLRLHGETISPRSYHEANALGIFRVFQEPALIDVLPVYENMFFGWEDRFRTRAGVLARSRMRRRSRAVLEELGVAGIDVRRKVGGLTPGARQSLDIARVVGLAELLEIEHPVVLFDEPTSALDQEHEENFLRLLERLRDRAAVMFVSHRLPEVIRTCGRLVVLKDGEKTEERPSAGAVESDLHQMMVGRVREANYYRTEEQRPAREGAPLLEVDDVTGAVVRGASFSVAPGEVLGIAGTEGSGKRELGEIIGGVRPPLTGSIRLQGREYRGGIAGAVRRGIGYVPPDRQHNGLIMAASIVSNVQLPSLADRYATRLGGVWRRSAARRAAAAAVERLGIVTRGIDAPVSTLSGGNAQKVLLAKWLMRDPKLLVLDNPTQGVDTGAREGIYQLVRVAAAEGTTIVVIGDDLPELVGLSNRVLVITDGEIVESFDAPVDAKPAEGDVVARMIPGATDPPADPDHPHPQTNGSRAK
ncbi:MAG TPA: sugar ABC transporter ATP-binding protein [Solirubrobacterales bacterium]|nr:sugar ABC transporter ATP-binding protein [Solirubrobacterales bacterium]